MQMEINKAEVQLSKSVKMLHDIDQLYKLKPVSKVEYGSLIQTNRGVYFFGIPLGKIETKSEVIYALSLASPLGKVCLHKSINQSFVFNGNVFTIKNIC